MKYTGGKISSRRTSIYYHREHKNDLTVLKVLCREDGSGAATAMKSGSGQISSQGC